MRPEEFSSRDSQVYACLAICLAPVTFMVLPYALGMAGGMVYLAAYLVFLWLLGYPALVLGLTLGRISRSGVHIRKELQQGNLDKLLYYVWFTLGGAITLAMLLLSLLAASQSVMSIYDLVVADFPRHLRPVTRPDGASAFVMATCCVLYLVASLTGMRSGFERWVSALVFTALIAVIVLAIQTMLMDGWIAPQFSSGRVGGYGGILLMLTLAGCHALMTVAAGSWVVYAVGAYANHNSDLLQLARRGLWLNSLIAMLVAILYMQDSSFSPIPVVTFQLGSLPNSNAVLYVFLLIAGLLTAFMCFEGLAWVSRHSGNRQVQKRRIQLGVVAFLLVFVLNSTTDLISEVGMLGARDALWFVLTLVPVALMLTMLWLIQRIPAVLIRRAYSYDDQPITLFIYKIYPKVMLVVLPVMTVRMLYTW